MSDLNFMLMFFIITALIIAIYISYVCFMNNKDRPYNKYAQTLIVFGLICLFTSFQLGSNSNFIKLNQNENVYGPLIVATPNSVYNISIKESLRDWGSWDYANVEVLDSKKEYLFSFGKELYKEKGRDSDGYWTETVNNFKTNISLKQVGTYYFKLNLENPKPGVFANFYVYKKSASSLPHKIIGCIALIIGIITMFILNPEEFEDFCDKFGD